jgi:hypothetical protein
MEAKVFGLRHSRRARGKLLSHSVTEEVEERKTFVALCTNTEMAAAAQAAKLLTDFGRLKSTLADRDGR